MEARMKQAKKTSFSLIFLVVFALFSMFSSLNHALSGENPGTAGQQERTATFYVR
jgi:hypothetical protein